MLAASTASQLEKSGFEYKFDAYSWFTRGGRTIASNTVGRGIVVFGFSTSAAKLKQKSVVIGNGLFGRSAMTQTELLEHRQCRDFEVRPSIRHDGAESRLASGFLW